MGNARSAAADADDSGRSGRAGRRIAARTLLEGLRSARRGLFRRSRHGIPDAFQNDDPSFRPLPKGIASCG